MSYGNTPGGYGGEGVNTSGQGTSAAVPPEVKGWNWGAFFLTFIWGLAHRVWISLLALLSFIPYIGTFIALGIAIFLGVKGNELAWQAKHWESVQKFKETQKKWAIAGFVVFVIVLVLSFTFGFMAGYSGS